MNAIPKRKIIVGTVGVIAAALALVAVPSASSVGRYNDPSGDSGAAPDVTGATVSSTADGSMVFRVGITNLPASGDAQTLLLIDSDANPDTGRVDSAGADFFFYVDQADSTYSFGRWTGSAWNWDTPYSTVRVNTASTGVTITVNRTELGNTNQVNFWTRTRTAGGGEGNEDTAPDDGLWNYDLNAGGPDIQGVTITTKPAFGPKAGKRFAIEIAGLKLPPSDQPVSILPQPESTTCAATLAGRRLAGSGCSWKLPKKARGKSLVVSVTVTYQGASKTIPFNFRVS